MNAKHLLIGAVVSLCALLASPLVAQNWEAEIGIISPDALDDSIYSASLNYYFKPLKSGTNTPWAEIDFVERISSLSGRFTTVDSSFELFAGEPGFSTIELKRSMDAYGVGYTNRSADSPHSFNAAFEYQKMETDRPSITRWVRFPGDVIEQRVDIESVSRNAFRYQIGYEYYIGNTWTVGTDLSLFERVEYDEIDFTLKTKRLWELSSNRAVVLSAALSRTELKFTEGSADQWIARTLLDYYFSPKSSLSFGLELPEGGDQRTYFLAAQHFFNEKAFAKIGFEVLELDLPSFATDELGIDDKREEFRASLGMRF